MEFLPENLAKFYAEAESLCRNKYKLDPFDIEFYVLTPEYLNSIASHGGFPRVIDHWTNGLEHELLKQKYKWGYGKIYELVINNDPAYAYLMNNNSDCEQKLVICHVIGHVDFFKNNIYFSKTNRNMLNEIANHAARIEKYKSKFGALEVEQFLDACLSIKEHIDLFAPFQPRKPHDVASVDQMEDAVPDKYPCDADMDIFFNSPEYIKKRKEELKKKQEKSNRFPETPDKDLLGFLLENAPLKLWQQDVLGMIRKESYYFNPQRQTKILNEGFASYWHHKLMTEEYLSGSEAIDFALDHSGTLAWNPWSMNPYYFGFSLLHDVKIRWDRGQFGPEWEGCKDREKRKNWNKELSQGENKILEIRAEENDYSFIDKYLNPDFCEEHKLYIYDWDQNIQKYVIKSRDFDLIKNQLLTQYSNWGIPYIVVHDGNYKNRGELMIMHRHEQDLREDWALDWLKNVHAIWQRPVHLMTKVEGKSKFISYGTTEEQDVDFGLLKALESAIKLAAT